LVLGITSIMLVSCKEKKPVEQPKPQPERPAVKLVIRHVFGERTLVPNENTFNTLHNSIGISNLSYFLTNFQFQRPDGSWHALEQFELIEAHLKNPDTIVFENLPKGAYTGMRFLLGIDSVNNHADPALWPNEHALGLMRAGGMHWSWNAGYIFLKVEGHYRTNNTQPGIYSYHIGRTELVTPYEFEALNFNFNNESVVLNARFDLKNFFNQPHAHIIADTSGFTHSSIGDPKAEILHANSFDLISFE
jgi:hypothetical protein